MKIVVILSSMLSIAVLYSLRFADLGRDVFVITSHQVRDVAIDIIMAPFRQVYAETRRHIERFCISAYQVIRGLKPEYRDSYLTHGLSLRL